MLQERDQSGGHADNLQRGHVHIVHVFGRHQRIIRTDAAGDGFFQNLAVFVHFGIGLGDHFVVFGVSGQFFNFIGYFAVFHFAVRRFNQTVFVDLGIAGQRGNQTDVRSFRRFNGANAAVVGIVYVAHFKAGAFSVQAAGTQSGQTAFMRQFAQRVNLVHKLGQLGRTEKLAHNSLHRLGINQSARSKRGQLAVHAVTRGFGHLGQAHADLVFQQLPDTAYAAVAQVVNIVHFKGKISAVHFLRVFAGV